MKALVCAVIFGIYFLSLPEQTRCNQENVWSVLSDYFEERVIPASDIDQPEVQAFVSAFRPPVNANPTEIPEAGCIYIRDPDCEPIREAVSTEVREVERGSRGSRWCMPWGGYVTGPAADGDVCCGTQRAHCVWAIPFLLWLKPYPVWKARVFSNGNIVIQYQYWYDVRCGRGSCGGGCSAVTHGRKVLTTGQRPRYLRSDIPGWYGYPSLRMRYVGFQSYNEVSYCRCGN